MEDIKTEVLTCREGTILALMVDKLDTSHPEDTEEFMLSDVSDPDLTLVQLGGKFRHKTGWRTGSYWKSRASWLEFEGSSLEW